MEEEKQKEVNELLLEAATQGNLSNMAALLERGADIDYRNTHDECYAALHLAVANKHYECVELLLKNGAYINIDNQFGDTPLHLAAGNGEHQLVSLLIQKGADIDYEADDRWTPLHKAAFSNQVDCFKILFERGAKTDIVNYDQETAIDIARNSGTKIIDFLRATKEKRALLSSARQKKRGRYFHHMSVLSQMIHVTILDFDCEIVR